MCDIPNPIICPGWLVICPRSRLVEWKLHNHIMVFSPWHIAIYWVIGLASGKTLATIPPLFWETVVPAEFFSRNELIGQIQRGWPGPGGGEVSLAFCWRPPQPLFNRQRSGARGCRRWEPGFARQVWEGFIKRNAPGTSWAHVCKWYTFDALSRKWLVHWFCSVLTYCFQSRSISILARLEEEESAAIGALSRFHHRVSIPAGAQSLANSKHCWLYGTW